MDPDLRRTTGQYMRMMTGSAVENRPIQALYEYILFCIADMMWWMQYTMVECVLDMAFRLTVVWSAKYNAKSVDIWVIIVGGYWVWQNH